MEIVACRQCGHQVARHADRCPQCGVYRPGRRRGRALLALGIIAIVLIIAAGAGGAFSSHASPASAPVAPAHRYATLREAEWDAYYGCKDAVLAQLKAPTQADVSGLDDSDPRWRGDVLTLRGTVDAPNPFGVKMRATWTCTLRVTLDRITPLAFRLDDPT